jgi:hypothetical protein
MFEHLEKNFTIYNLLLNNEGVGFFRNRLYAAVAQTVTGVICMQPENNAFSNSVTVHFLTSGFIGVSNGGLTILCPAIFKKLPANFCLC